MEAFPEVSYNIENNPEPKDIGTIVIYTTFISPVDMDSILTESRFSCSLSAKEFIEDEASPTKQELFYFLKESGVDEYDAIKLILKLIKLAFEITLSVEYNPRYALSVWLNLHVVPSIQEPVIEEGIQASLDDYESNIGSRPALKLAVESLSRRRYKRKPKTSLMVDHCTICLEEFKTGQKVVTLPCGHEFDSNCVVEWFKVSHVCPLCRFELPYEEDDEFFSNSHGILTDIHPY